MKYRKILLAYNGSKEGRRALLECADLASFLQAETHLLAVASMPPSLFLTEGFVPEELLEEEKKRTQAVLDEGIRTLRDRGFNATGQLGEGTTLRKGSPTPVATDARFTTISGGGGHTCALTAEGSAYCWGDNHIGQLGIGAFAMQMTPVRIAAP